MRASAAAAAAAVVCLVLLALVPHSHGQDFQLFFGTTAGPQVAPGAMDPNCADKIGNCASFGADACTGQYLAWAKDNCALTCKFCTGPSTTEAPCVDAIDNCASYQKDSCTNSDYRSWAEANCRRTCRFCSQAVLNQLDALTTTIPPEQCVDKVDCRLYGKSSCTGDYLPWAKQNCMNYCGFCQGAATTAKPCLDSRPNCSQYQKDMCNSPTYTLWVDDNCPQYCGRCGGSGGSAGSAGSGGPGSGGSILMTPPPVFNTPPPLNPGK
ncbi:uncharacterized protein LOC143278634 [Babylonia areolata]|uniref:uncharacterized protein LOC143278634 n=1 Tax=Babylonia areolata TaxID=304850 RepID=UPI003FD1919D